MPVSCDHDYWFGICKSCGQTLHPPIKPKDKS